MTVTFPHTVTHRTAIDILAGKHISTDLGKMTPKGQKIK
jgi:hypothetical protein